MLVKDEEIFRLKQEIKQLKYINTSLNQFVHDKCIHNMSYINIDGLSARMSKNSIRCIEYKHQNESDGNMKSGQWYALQVLAGVFRKLKYFINTYGAKENINPYNELGVYLTKGDMPFNTLDVYDLVNQNRSYRIKSQHNVIKWLEMDYNLEMGDKIPYVI